jgi:hypothetical protein
LSLFPLPFCTLLYPKHLFFYISSPKKDRQGGSLFNIFLLLVLPLVSSLVALHYYTLSLIVSFDLHLTGVIWLLMGVSVSLFVSLGPNLCRHESGLYRGRGIIRIFPFRPFGTVHNSGRLESAFSCWFQRASWSSFFFFLKKILVVAYISGWLYAFYALWTFKRIYNAWDMNLRLV